MLFTPRLSMFTIYTPYLTHCNVSESISDEAGLGREGLMI